MEYSILLVDDEEDFCQTLGQRLERMGYIVHTATCGRDALTVFRDVNPMIVLMDVMLPDDNGLDLMKQMKTENPDTEVIIITGHGNMELAVKSFQYDATDFITKPIDRECLANRRWTWRPKKCLTDVDCKNPPKTKPCGTW